MYRIQVPPLLRMHTMRLKTNLAVCAAIVAISGCSSTAMTEWVDPYRIDVRQGNYVDQELVSQLRKGMTREQVRYVLGSPLLVDAFRNDRWDYVYRFAPGKGEPEQRSISVYFENDVLSRVEANIGETGAEGSEPTRSARSRVVEVPAVTSGK